MKISPKFWDKISAKYARDPVTDQAAYEYTLGRSTSYLKPTDVVLELGAGTASTAVFLAPLVQEFIASDFSKGMIAQGNAKPEVQDQKNLKLVHADIFDPVLHHPGYDVVMAHSLLHLVRDLDAVLAHVHSLTKPGGLFISKTVSEFGEGTSWKFRLIKLAIPLAQLLGKAPFVRFYKIPELEARITAAGFEIVEAGNFPANPPTRYIVARKV